MPLAVGLKTTEAAQLLAAARVELHEFLDMLKSPALAPDIAALEKVTEAEVALVRSTDCAALLDPIAVEAKERLDGFGERVLATAPRPVRVTI